VTDDPVTEPTVAADAPADKPILARASIRRNVLHMLTSQLFTWVLATVLAMVVPRFLGPENQGGLRLAYSLWTIAGILMELGTSKFLQLEIARHPREGIRLVGPVLAIRTTVWVVSSLGLLAYALATTRGDTFVAVIAIVGVGTLLSTSADAIGAAYIGMERMATPAMVAAITKAVNTVAVIVLLALGGGIYGVVVLGAVALGIGLVQIYWHFRQVARITFDGWRSHVGRIVKESTPFMLAGASLVVYQQIDVVVISWVAGDRDLGWYSTADVLVGSLLFPATVIVTTIFPTLGRLHTTDQEELQRLVRRVFSLLVLAGVPIGLGTMVVGKSFAPLLYGEEFRGTGSVLTTLGPMIILTFGTILFGTLALATGRGPLWVGVLFGAAALTIPLDLLLVPWASDRWDNGAIGGAISFVITESLQFAIGISIVAPYLLQRVTMWRAVRILAAGGVMVACAWPFRDRFAAIPVAIGAMVYVAAVFALRVVGHEERHLLKRLARSAR
jgi:O-antigen/teichoic acid export membrane protein